MIAGSKHDRNRKAMIVVVGGTTNFDPSVNVSGTGFTRWDLGDGTVKPNSTNFVHAYADANIYRVVAWRRYMNQFESVQMQNDDLRSIDLTHMDGLGGSIVGNILLNNNSNLTSINFPDDHTATGVINNISIYNCDLTGPISLNGLKRVTGTVWAHQNDNMTSFDASNPLEGGDITSVQVMQCNSLITADLSGMVGMRGLLQWRNCSSLNAILFPNNLGVSTGQMVTMNGYQCPNITTLAFGNFENIGGQFRVYQCPNLSVITFPAAPTNKFTEFRVEQCDILGVLDISQFDATGQIRIQNNFNLTGFLAPTVTGGDSISLFWAQNCDLTGVLNLSSIDVLQSSFLIYNNTNLTGITFNSTAHSQPFNTFWAYNCDLTGTLNISMFQNLGGRLRVYGNSNLSSINNPTSSGIFTEYWAYQCGLTGTLDVSNLTGLGGEFEVDRNLNLTGINVPVSSENFTEFYANDCDLTGTLDLTGLTGGFRIIRLYNNTNLTGVTFDPAINQIANDLISFRIQNCDLTGTLDLSPLDRLSGLLYVYNNPNLTGITLPTSSVLLNDVRVDDCDITGTLDLSTVNLGGSILGDSNVNLTGITNPTNNNSFDSYVFDTCNLSYVDMTTLTGLFDTTGVTVSFNGNNMTTAEVNNMLVDFDNNSSAAISGRSLDLSGTGMGAPDGSSGGFDGLTAKTNLQSKGWTITTN